MPNGTPKHTKFKVCSAVQFRFYASSAPFPCSHEKRPRPQIPVSYTSPVKRRATTVHCIRGPRLLNSHSSNNYASTCTGGFWDSTICVHRQTISTLTGPSGPMQGQSISASPTTNHKCRTQGAAEPVDRVLRAKGGLLGDLGRDTPSASSAKLR